jgi:hypothetical protein
VFECLRGTVYGVHFVYVVYVVSEALAACSFNLEAVNEGAESGLGEMVYVVHFVYVVHVVSEALAACSFKLEAVNVGAEFRIRGNGLKGSFCLCCLCCVGSTCSLQL